MMGERQVDQAALFYEFSLERHVPSDHMLRSIDRFVDLTELRAGLAPLDSPIGRPSIDPELLIRMLLVGYCFGIRSERRLCEEVHLNLAYRWFCRLGLDGDVPDHSTFSKNRHGRFRESDLLRQLFETVVRRCMAEGLVGGEGFAVDASLIAADANRQRCVPGDQGLPPEATSRAIDEYLAVLDDAAFGAATPVTPKFISPADPASRWTGANKGLAFFAYATNYLIDLDHAVIVDVEASTAVRQAEVTAARTMIERVREHHDLSPQRLAADTAYGSTEMLDWLVNEQGVEPHIPVMDKSNREDGTFSRSDFAYDRDADLYRCPGGKELKQHRRAFRIDHPDVPPDDTYRYRASKPDCDACALKSQCCPNTPARKVTRSIYEAARDFTRDIAKTDAYVTSRRERKKVEMLFAHLKRILNLGRLRLRGPCGARDEFHLAATAQNLRKLAKLIPIAAPAITWGAAGPLRPQTGPRPNSAFFNEIGQERAFAGEPFRGIGRNTHRRYHLGGPQVLPPAQPSSAPARSAANSALLSRIIARAPIQAAHDPRQALAVFATSHARFARTQTRKIRPAVAISDLWDQLDSCVAGPGLLAGKIPSPHPTNLRGVLFRAGEPIGGERS